MGGWTRIWVVLAALVSGFAAWVYVDDIHYAEQRASDADKNALNAYDACRQAPPQPKAGVLSSQPPPGDTGPISDLYSTLQSACDYAAQPRAQYAKQQARQRDAAIATAKREAAEKAVSTVGWVSGTVGALFLAVGWIRRGFRKTKQG